MFQVRLRTHAHDNGVHLAVQKLLNFFGGSQVEDLGILGGNTIAELQIHNGIHAPVTLGPQSDAELLALKIGDLFQVGIQSHPPVPLSPPRLAIKQQELLFDGLWEELVERRLPSQRRVVKHIIFSRENRAFPAFFVHTHFPEVVDITRSFLSTQN